MEREQIVAALREGVCKVTFTKVDGSQRIMMATLEPSTLPPIDGTKKERKMPPSIVTVYDTEVEDWRCFRLESVLSFEPA